ncbi:hypothetical protein [Paraburkholderia sp. Ac-20347]|uniref:hypothetical protein n=1 Tax=Paraburkholderia sp. Ac-20347 TaxID=2703892 RepID=UPI00197FB7BC|nr:hypothetical protein [Paraburkholderia sp. Ac-20347]MBN3813654.1 hypothetical protein [Paraburkholderia sp. Ac-20347]
MPKKRKQPFDISNERKLTDQDVLVIRAVHIPRSPRFGSVILAQLFGVSQPTIDRAVKRETYRHLHPLLLPAWRIRGERQIRGERHLDLDLGDSAAKIVVWARNKTEYNRDRREIRERFAMGDYVRGLKGEFQESRGMLSVYAPRPVCRVISPEGAQRRREKQIQRRLATLKQTYGEAYNERIGLAVVGLTPRLSIEEFDALGGVRWRDRGNAPMPDDIYDDDQLNIPDF